VIVYQFGGVAWRPLSRVSQFIELEEKYGAHNYHPIPVVLDRGLGVFPVSSFTLVQWSLVRL
jgi:hypothetical protein